MNSADSVPVSDRCRFTTELYDSQFFNFRGAGFCVFVARHLIQRSDFDVSLPI